MLFRIPEVGGVKLFYREAGSVGAPKLVLLHGFPVSSHQYRNLIPALASRFHIVAPDYPGFGNSDIPEPNVYSYSFDKISDVLEAFLENVGFTHFGLYVQDYGGRPPYRPGHGVNFNPRSGLVSKLNRLPRLSDTARWSSGWIPAFGVRGASFFLGTTEWLFGALILLGFWRRRLGVIGALGSIVTFLGTVTIIPFFPNAWATEAGGFPAMNLSVAFLMKDFLFLAASFYLLKQDLARAALEIARN